MRILRFIPFLIIPILIYASVALTSVGHMDERLNAIVFSLTMASGDVWKMSFGGVILTIAVLCLFGETLRSALPTGASIAENLSTAVVLIACIGLFLLMRGFATGEFFLLVLFLLIDYLTDAAVMVFTARRTMDVTR